MSFVPKRNRLLFVGDSLTCYSGGWQHVVSKQLGLEYDNISKGGKRTDWMEKKLREHLSNNSDYGTVVIYGGINDSFAYSHPNLTIKNIQRMVDLCNEKKIKPVVIVGYDPSKVNFKTVYSDKVTEFHRKRYIDLQKRIETEVKNCKIIPMEPTIDRTDSGDGIHLKSSGHRKFYKWVLKNW
jgi:hypothetical protein